MKNTYVIHKNDDGTRSIHCVTQDVTVATCANDVLAATLLAVVLLAEIETEIDWHGRGLELRKGGVA